MTSVIETGARPKWLNKRLVLSPIFDETRSALNSLRINTVCESSRCPNLTECFSRRNATFLILGRNCTRACAFCSINKGLPARLDTEEPYRLASAAKRLGVKHVVITSVTRDDLEDGGASQFVACVKALRELSVEITVEVLVPDFAGKLLSVDKVLASGPHVFGHNMETTRRLYPALRKGADYDVSLSILKKAASFSPNVVAKSGIILGLGESEDEIRNTILDIREAGCDMLTIGQYLAPSSGCEPVHKFYRPEEFEFYRDMAIRAGFKVVSAGSFVRSSYLAEMMYKETKGC
ncbi:MAG: lipoyl synthase [Candidatus Omnitrophica bacterium]|nr:lipoyl synthase [Candidatus Omnitrophota bacterium]